MSGRAQSLPKHVENTRSEVPLLQIHISLPSCLKPWATLGGLNPDRNGEEKQPPEPAFSDVVVFENSYFAGSLSLGIVRNTWDLQGMKGGAAGQA